MKAMILAAGRGERMRPLTDDTPKPLLRVGGRCLIEWQLLRLVAAGFDEVVINHAWLGAQIEHHIGDGSAFGARVSYSAEAEALETLGGIVQALPLLGDQPFVVVSADIYTDYDYRHLVPVVQRLASQTDAALAHLVLTDNPPWHARGDMALVDGRIRLDGERLNYGNIGVFHPRLFAGLARGKKLKLFPWAYGFLDQPGITGEHFHGAWFNVGTPAQLAELDMLLQTRTKT